MPDPLAGLDVSQLSVPQRLNLIALLWDSIPDSAEALPVPESHRQEIERRLAEAEASPEKVVPWDEVRRRLRGES
jgi:putative addiction module component (TIGR02574 family)